MLFSDGSFEGKTEVVRTLKAHRDGLAASLNYWADRMRAEPSGGAALRAFFDELQGRLTGDEEKASQSMQSQSGPGLMEKPLYGYWTGRQRVERNLQLRVSRDVSEPRASKMFRQAADEILAWQKKIESNIALKQLNSVFPPISDAAEIGDKAPGQSMQARLQLAAQSSSYHVETYSGRGGPYPYLVLVNDSQKQIEAFAASQQCEHMTSGDSRDVLGFSGTATSDMMAPGEERPPRSGVLDTGARWITSIAFIPANGPCQEKIDAVIFSDGSFEGNADVMRTIKAGRDGYAAGVNYWADRIRQEKPGLAKLQAFSNEVNRRIPEEKRKANELFLRAQQGRHDAEVTTPLSWYYWSGKQAVDVAVELNFLRNLSEEKASEDFGRLARFILAWQNKIERNVALKQLNYVFPPLSEVQEAGDKAPGRPIP